MNKDSILTAVNRMREFSKKRNFSQSVDFCINFTGLDFKKPQNRIDIDVALPNPTGKKGNSKALVFVKDKAFAEKLSGKVKVILESEIQNLKTKQVEQLINEFELFLAEGPAILTVAKYLGQQLAPRGKMPKPIINDLKSFESMLEKASTSVKVSNTKGKFMPLVHIMIGKENDDDEKISENALSVFNSVQEAAGGKQYIKSSFVKLTMGPSIKLGLSKEEFEQLKERLSERGVKKKKVGKK